MKKYIQKNFCCIPLILWFVIIPLIVKVKFFPNPLAGFSWYSNEETLADFFLYYKSVFITITGVLMLAILFWQISKMRRKDTLFHADTRIFIPLAIYLVLVICSSLFSKYGYFCTHGMPDQFETVWNLIAYVIAVVYCYCLMVYQDSDVPVVGLMFIGAALVGAVCVLQYLKIDVYRLMYAGKGYTFTFAEGTVYGPFYNINYVGFYTLLFTPLFLLLLLLYPNVKVKIASAILTVMLIISMIGAESSTAVIAFVSVILFTILFILLKNTKKMKLLWIPIICILLGGIVVCVAMIPRMEAYLQASDTQKMNLERIYTNDDNVEIDYKGNKLTIQMQQGDGLVEFTLKDQNQADVVGEYAFSDEGYYYLDVKDERFAGMTITPTLLVEESEKYGFIVLIEDKNWCFSNQMTDDGTYYYYTDLGKLTKLTEDNVSPNFQPLVHLTSLANGRGYIWNKSIAILKDYIFLGSGADTFAIAFPNDDLVDKYNSGYNTMVITKPHNMYLQIAVQTGVLSLICFLVFYAWYFISSLKIYFRQRIDNLLVITGFAMMLGTLGYMISGLANDSTVTVSPLFWAMIGIGIGINHRIKTGVKA